MTTATIDGIKYDVEYRFLMVGNWFFTDENGVEHLVDGEDVSVWADENNIKWDGVNTAIAYANELGAPFWWKVKESK